MKSKATKESELMLIIGLEKYRTDKNMVALILQSYIQEYGALSNEVGEKVKLILEQK